MSKVEYINPKFVTDLINRINFDIEALNIEESVFDLEKESDNLKGSQKRKNAYLMGKFFHNKKRAKDLKEIVEELIPYTKEEGPYMKIEDCRALNKKYEEIKEDKYPAYKRSKAPLVAGVSALALVVAIAYIHRNKIGNTIEKALSVKSEKTIVEMNNEDKSTLDDFNKMTLEERREYFKENIYRTDIAWKRPGAEQVYIEAQTDASVMTSSEMGIKSIYTDAMNAVQQEARLNEFMEYFNAMNAEDARYKDITKEDWRLVMAYFEAGLYSDVQSFYPKKVMMILTTALNAECFDQTLLANGNPLKKNREAYENNLPIFMLCTDGSKAQRALYELYLIRQGCMRNVKNPEIAKDFGEAYAAFVVEVTTGMGSNYSIATLDKSGQQFALGTYIFNSAQPTYEADGKIKVAYYTTHGSIQPEEIQAVIESEKLLGNEITENDAIAFIRHEQKHECQEKTIEELTWELNGQLICGSKEKKVPVDETDMYYIKSVPKGDPFYQRMDDGFINDASSYIFQMHKEFIDNILLNNQGLNGTQDLGSSRTLVK